MALQKELWISDIQNYLASDNTFLTKLKNYSIFVENNKVHLPFAGAPSSISVDRSSLPAAISTRTDNDFTFSLHRFSTDPIRVHKLSDIELSYDKRASIIENDLASLKDTMVDYFLYYIAPSAATSKVAMTGTFRATDATSATGSRSGITLANVYEASKIMTKQNIPTSGRIMVVTPNVLKDIVQLSTFVYTDRLANESQIEGLVGRLGGFDIYVRDRVLEYNANGAAAGAAISPSASGTSAAAVNEAVICLHPNYVAYALGEVNIFMDENNPSYYGDIMSIEVRGGATPLRLDGYGVVSIVESL